MAISLRLTASSDAHVSHSSYNDIKYAHRHQQQLLCSRATFYFDHDLNFSDAGGSSDDTPFDLNRWKAGFGRITDAMKRKMFYV